MKPSPLSSKKIASHAIPEVPIDTLIAGAKKSLTEEVKRKRGRPRKVDISASAQTSSDAAPLPSDASAVPVPPSALSAEIPDAVVRPMVKLPFVVAATMTKFEGFELTKDEVEEIMPPTKAVLQKWLPTLAGESSPEFILGATVLALVGQKMILWVDWKQTQKEKMELREFNRGTTTQGRELTPTVTQ